MVILNILRKVFLDPTSYLWALFSLHQFSVPTILLSNVAPNPCTIFGYWQDGLVLSRLRVLPWVQQCLLDLLSLVFLSNTGFSVVCLFVFDWAWNACICIESTKIIFCDWLSLRNRFKLMLARFAMASLSFIDSHASAYIASIFVNWDYVSCAWFSEAPYLCDSTVAFLWIW